MFLIKKRKTWRNDNFVNCGDYVVYDSEIVEFLKKHMRFVDRLDLNKVLAAEVAAYEMICYEKESHEPFKSGKWYFRFLEDGQIKW